ncbi:MAG: Abi family protein [Candidatus Eremiobacteraeota bacterium]|nr:Abi family protein [Candidatus Eremiobacteraeota bacterium]
MDARLEAEVERLIGSDRFTRYQARASNTAEALKLYSWNTAIAGAFLGPIAVVEVALRNAVSEQLRAAFGHCWYDDPSFLALDPSTRVRGSIADAKNRIGRAVPARAVTDGRVVAELYLSFWVYLLRPVFSRTLWPILQPGFAKHTHRKTLVRYLEPLVPFRNRIAHHEPIFDRRPGDMYDGLLRVAGMISADLPSWIEHHARVRAVLADGPVTTGVKF